MKKIKVLIIEDSKVVRTLLEEVINRDPWLTVVGAVESAEEGIRLLPRLKPDVISLDIRLPGMNGFEATERIMTDHPTPIVICSASVEKEDLKVSINALKAGALSIVEKPDATMRSQFEKMTVELCTQLAIMSEVKVVRQRPGRRITRAVKHPTPVVTGYGPFQMLGIVASTGGPAALEKVLTALPRNFSLPILLVQHITSTFLEGFVGWLSSVTKFPASIAQEGEVPEPGHIYVAPADRHLVVRSGRLYLASSAPVHLQRPSGTVLFESMAKDLGKTGLGILLTGMGEDGAKGLLALREAGGYTIAEDESTAVVYGMPGTAVRLGGVSESLPLHEISGRILELV